MTMTETTAGCATQAGKYLTFMLGREHYGIPVLKVREIIRVCDITHVPRMPEYVKGVINLRGKIIPVMDLCARFNLTQSDHADRLCIVVIHVVLAVGGETQMGFIVSAVDEVVNVAADKIEATPDFGAQISTDYIRGMAKLENRVVALLDIDRVIGTQTASES